MFNFESLSICEVEKQFRVVNRISHGAVEYIFSHSDIPSSGFTKHSLCPETYTISTCGIVVSGCISESAFSSASYLYPGIKV